MSEDEKKPPYDVGYGKPPLSTRFKPGQSGNPKGKPKGSKNFFTDLEAELKTRIPVTENGKRKKITKQKAIAKQIVNKAVSGDARAIPVLLNEIRQREGIADPHALTAAPMEEVDRLVMGNVIERIRRHDDSQQNAGHEQKDAPRPTSHHKEMKNDSPDPT